MRNHHLRVCPQPRLDAARLPLPEHDVALAVSAADPLAVWGEAHLAGVPGDGVSSEALIPRLPEVVRAVDQDLVVEALRGEVLLCISIQMSGQCWVVFESSQMRELTTWMNRDCGHRVHVRLCDILDDNRDVEVPGSDGLVIGCRDETPVLIDEGNRVHRTKVLVVFLRNLPRIHVVLTYSHSE